jgi:pyridoxine 5'-phosphate synthase PdxJ
MARVTIDLEPLANLYLDGSDMVKSVVKNALACEIAGADSVIFGLGKELDQRRRKAASLLIDSLDIGLALRTGCETRSLEVIKDLKPAMALMKYSQDKKEALGAAITNLQVENILAALEIPLDIDQVKEAARLKCDYLVLNCEPYCSAKTINAQLDELSKISKLATLAGRLSMGIIVAGDFTAIQLSKLNGAGPIEEYVMGLPFFSNSLIHGYSKALQILKYALS